MQHLKKKNIEIDLGSRVEVEVDVLGSPVPNSSPYGLCGRKATLEKLILCSLEREEALVVLCFGLPYAGFVQSSGAV